MNSVLFFIALVGTASFVVAAPNAITAKDPVESTDGKSIVRLPVSNVARKSEPVVVEYHPELTMRCASLAMNATKVNIDRYGVTAVACMEMALLMKMQCRNAAWHCLIWKVSEPADKICYMAPSYVVVKYGENTAKLWIAASTCPN